MRNKRMARLARVQRALARAASADKIAAEGQVADAEGEREEILSTLNKDGPIHGYVVAAMARALKRNAQRIEEARRTVEAASRRAVEEEATARILEDRQKATQAAEASRAERLRLEHLCTEARQPAQASRDMRDLRAPRGARRKPPNRKGP
jgi:hypothetical protein